MTSTPRSSLTSDIPFHGFVETTGDAIRLIQAARRGTIPRITRRLNDEERATAICSGAVFVFCVEESGIKRWTEGLSWSASRIAGNFLLYRELTNRNSGRTSYTGKTLSAESAFSRRKLIPREQDHNPTFKPDGLIKKTITISADETQYHLISYYSEDDVRARRLQRPNSRADIMALEIPRDLLDATNYRYPPTVEFDVSGNVINIREADESNVSTSIDSQISHPYHNQLPPIQTSDLLKADSSNSVPRTSRRPRAIRPAKPHSPTSTSPHDVTAHYMPGTSVPPTEARNFITASSPYHDVNSRHSSSFSTGPSRFPSIPQWHNEGQASVDSDDFVERSSWHGSQASINAYQTTVPSSVPPSSFGFTDSMSSRRDVPRTHSYTSVTSPSTEGSVEGSYYYPQRFPYQHSNSHGTFYSDNFSIPTFEYPTSGYHGQYDEEGR